MGSIIHHHLKFTIYSSKYVANLYQFRYILLKFILRFMNYIVFQ